MLDDDILTAEEKLNILAAGARLAFLQHQLLDDMIAHLPHKNNIRCPKALKISAQMSKHRGLQGEWAAKKFEWGNTQSNVFYEAALLLAHLEVQLMDDTMTQFAFAFPDELKLRVQKQRAQQVKWAVALGQIEFEQFCVDVYRNRDIASYSDDDNLGARVVFGM